MKKSNNFIILQNKGGVGKSTFAQQIAATFNLAANNKAFITELDDQNHDSAGLTNSIIVTKQQPVKSKQFLKNAWSEMDILSLDDTNKIIDVGGNLTADWFIEAVVGTPFIANDVDAVFIPVIDNDISVSNAQKIYEKLAAHDELSELLDKVIFVINNVSSDYTENVDKEDFDKESFISSIEKRYYNAFDLFETKNKPYLIVGQMDAIENAKLEFKMTAYEIAKNFKELNKEATATAIATFKDKGASKFEKTSAGARVLTTTNCKNVYMPQILFAHKQLQEILDSRNNEAEIADENEI